jgi:Lrp/AsnC family transcriptional regulator of ectoine degradation
MHLDQRDLQILRVLSVEGRITKSALADRIGLSPTPCWDRLKKLEQAGLIDGYGARINLKKLAPHVTVFVAVEISDHTAASFHTFEEAMQRFDEITACWALGGGFDYLLQIVTRDIDAYQRLIDDMLAAAIGLSRYFTYVVTKPVKGNTAPPLDVLLGNAPSAIHTGRGSHNG